MLYGRYMEMKATTRRKKLPRLSQGSSFLGSSFSNRDNVESQSNIEKEDSPNIKDKLILEDEFSFEKDIHFCINNIRVIRQVKQNKLTFFSIQINQSLPAPVYNVLQVTFNFRS